MDTLGLHHNIETTRYHKNHHIIETYLEATENALTPEEQYDNKGKCCNNLIKGERTAQKELTNKNDISTTKADKGGAVNIDVEEYAKKAEHQLNNKDTYKNPSK